MQKIIPHLWFDKEAKEAAEFYTSAIENSKVTNVYTLHDTPGGDADVVAFELAGQQFMSISAGPLFKFNPSISFHIKCKSAEEVDALWKKFSDGATVLMELGEYPFSKRYGWLQDKYGLSWQIIYTDRSFEQKITPAIMYVGNVAGKAEEAVKLYTSVFKPSEMGMIMRYGKGEEPDKEGTVKYADFSLLGMRFGAMDSAHDHKFSFNEAISFMIQCVDQKEIDYYWEKLSAVPEAEQCGWLKDKFGVSWQVTPADMEEKLAKGTPEQVARLTEAFLKMKKFDLATLQKAYEGK